MRLVRLLFLLCAMADGTAAGEASSYVALAPGITLETGDSWIDHGERYRLYGVQSCLRGTFYTDRAGDRRDCGEASMAVFAAYIRDTHPKCAAVTTVGTTRYVLCYGTVATQRLDLGTALIVEGYAFAALDAKGLPVQPSYAVAEQAAKERRTGLWQFADVQHPAVLLSRAARQSEGH
jgi:endonuclease YncB( thermonuclease family)